MSYQKQNFANGEVLTAAQLNHMENGIADAESTANTTKGVVDKIIDPTLSVSGKAADAAKVGEAVNAEATRAKAAEGQNATDISAESARAKQAESALSTKIEGETTRAQAAEKANADNLAAEVTRATGEEQRLDTAITAEKTRAEQAEQALSARTDALESCGFVVVDGKVCIRYMKKS